MRRQFERQFKPSNLRWVKKTIEARIKRVTTTRKRNFRKDADGATDKRQAG